MTYVLRSRLLVILGLTAVLAAYGYGQSGRIRPPAPARQEQGDKDTLRLRAEEVLLPVSVRSDVGKLPTRLERRDFIVTEDNKHQNITSVMRTPANILLILDASGEVATLKNININRELALKIIESLGQEDQAAIVTYSDSVELLAAWTSDKEALKTALDLKFKPGLKSRLYDSLSYGAEKVLPLVTGRRSVVVLTDGVDSFVNGGFERALAAMHRVRATVYVVNQAAMLVRELKPRVFNPLAWLEMLDPDVRRKYQYLRRYVQDLEAGDITFRGLAEETGGAVWDPEQRIECVRSHSHPIDGFGKPNDPSTRVDCEMIRNQLIEEIGTEYVVSYSSERPPNDLKFHPIRVFSTRPDLKIRVRRGIYAGLPPRESKESQ